MNKPVPEQQQKYTMKELLKDADQAKATALVVDPRGSATISSLLNHIPEYKRLDLHRILPEQYWKKVEPLGPPSVSGDPGEQAVNAAICYIICDVVGKIYGDPDGKLRDASRAERIMIDIFGDIAKAGTAKRGGKA